MEKVLRFRFIGISIILLGGTLIAFLTWKLLSQSPIAVDFDHTFFLFVFAGFIAQMIDGALGMAYGVSCSTLLLSFGMPPAVASASVHTAEVFSTGASGLSHLYFKNIDKNLFLRIVIPGVLGAMLGAYLICDVFDGKIIRPYISSYLLILGAVILFKGIKRQTEPKPIKRMFPLGFMGGLLDAIGGGGWGPIVTSNLINKGNAPKETIGTVNTAEFFITFFSTGVFLFFINISAWQVILGLIAGGVIAAPFGAFLVKLNKPRTIMLAVGILIVITSAYNLLKSAGILP